MRYFNAMDREMISLLQYTENTLFQTPHGETFRSDLQVSQELVRMWLYGVAVFVMTMRLLS